MSANHAYQDHDVSKEKDMSSGNRIDRLQDPRIHEAPQRHRAFLTGIVLAALMMAWGATGALADETC
jgi:hypothetical protein